MTSLSDQLMISIATLEKASLDNAIQENIDELRESKFMTKSWDTEFEKWCKNHPINRLLSAAVASSKTFSVSKGSGDSTSRVATYNSAINDAFAVAAAADYDNYSPDATVSRNAAIAGVISSGTTAVASERRAAADAADAADRADKASRSVGKNDFGDAMTISEAYSCRAARSTRVMRIAIALAKAAIAAMVVVDHIALADTM